MRKAPLPVMRPSSVKSWLQWLPPSVERSMCGPVELNADANRRLGSLASTAKTPNPVKFAGSGRSCHWPVLEVPVKRRIALAALPEQLPVWAKKVGFDEGPAAHRPQAFVGAL